MTTIPTERMGIAHLTFAQICRGIAALDAMEEELTLLPLTLSGRLTRALKYYTVIRPILMTLTVFGLLPSSLRNALLTFLQSLDAVAESLETPVTVPELPPLQGEPSSTSSSSTTREFKAGKDQAKPQKTKGEGLTFRPIRKVARDARTGAFITLAEAHRRPSSTVVETVTYPPRPAARKR